MSLSSPTEVAVCLPALQWRRTELHGTRDKCEVSATTQPNLTKIEIPAPITLNFDLRVEAASG